jgi:hypothetical protein
MSMSPLDNEAGRYVVGADSRPVTRRIYQEVMRRFNAGQGVTEIRRELRQMSKNDPNYKTSNAGVSGLVREFKDIKAKRGATTKVGKNRRPGKGSIVQSGMNFGARYRYFGEVHIWQTGEDFTENFTEEGVFGDDPIDPSDLEGEDRGEPYEVVPVYFSNDELLTRELIEEKLKAMGQAIAMKGGTNRANYQNNLYVHHVEIKSIQESAK